MFANDLSLLDPCSTFILRLLGSGAAVASCQVHLTYGSEATSDNEYGHANAFLVRYHRLGRTIQ